VALRGRDGEQVVMALDVVVERLREELKQD